LEEIIVSDYSPPYTDADARLDERRERVVKALERLPVKSLKVRDVVTIVQALLRHQDDLYPSQLDDLEKIIKRSKR
jgi:hypothetical protein